MACKIIVEVAGGGAGGEGGGGYGISRSIEKIAITFTKS